MTKTKEGNRMSSIAWRINGRIVWKQFLSYFWMDLGMFLLSSAAWCVAVEINQFGSFMWRGVSRWFEGRNPSGSIYYIVDRGKDRVLEADMTMFLIGSVPVYRRDSTDFIAVLSVNWRGEEDPVSAPPPE